jgi:Ca-activated chloride channel family protein
MAGNEPIDPELRRWFSGQRNSIHAPSNLWDRIEPRLGAQSRRPGWRQLFGFRFAFVRLTNRLVAIGALIGLFAAGSAIFATVSDSVDLSGGSGARNELVEGAQGAPGPSGAAVTPTAAAAPAATPNTWQGARLSGVALDFSGGVNSLEQPVIIVQGDSFQLGQPLTREQADALIPYLASGGYGMTPEQEAALRDKLMSSEWTTVIDPNRPIDLTFFKDYGINPFVNTADRRLSTFAMDVDTASYTVARGYLESGRVPPPESVRPEEYINFFEQGYVPAEDTFGIHVDGALSPYGDTGNYLLRVGVNTKEIAPVNRKPANIVLVIDTSGSMGRDNRIALVQRGIEALLEQLQEGDTVGIVTYSDTAHVLLEPTSDFELARALASDLRPNGSTNAQAGLRLGFSLAEQQFGENKSNHVVLLSDGVANVGETGPDGLISEIKEYAQEGISLSTVGVGLGNYNDMLLEQLANDGDGSYAYIDTTGEAQRVLGANITGLLEIVAEEAKVQVEFNPETVESYRLVGYENRSLAAEDFRDDSVDAGEVGAGHTVTAIYELRLRDSGEGQLGKVNVRWLDPDTREASELSRDMLREDVVKPFDTASARFRFTASVMAFAELLRHSPWFAGVTAEDILRTMSGAVESMEAAADEAELVSLVSRAIELGAFTSLQ